MRIAIVAGEASGDLLGGGLIHAVHKLIPGIQFEGIAGQRMVSAGCQPLIAADELAVMGLIEVLGRYRHLVAIRKQLYQRYLRQPPDLFIGIDAPDFNLGLELRLKQLGIPTIHYVSPSVWAWRRYRLRKIARATDLLLTLFPFEEAFYRQHSIKAHFVGHPLADMVPLSVDQGAARARLGVAADIRLVALLPGSRITEIRQMAPVFVQAASLCQCQDHGLRFICPSVNETAQAEFGRALRQYAPQLPVELVVGSSHDVMAAADIVLCASGTATLEAMLFKKPMVVAYRMAPMTYWVVRRMVGVKYVSLPNLLAGHEIVPEFIQQAATPHRLAEAVTLYLREPQRSENIKQQFVALHETLRMNANERAAESVLQLLGHDSLLKPKHS